MKTERFFVADKDSPLRAEILRIVNVRRKNHAALRKFMKKHGVTNAYGTTPAQYRFDVKDADPAKWTKTKPRRGVYYYVPKRTTPEGKALLAEVKALPEMPTVESAINIVPGLNNRMPMVFTDSRAYYPFIRFHSGDLTIVVVPTVDKKPSKGSINIDAYNWAPPPWLREVKEWEALKLIDEAGK